MRFIVWYVLWLVLLACAVGTKVHCSVSVVDSDTFRADFGVGVGN